jgi:hypothetical protein
MGKGIARRLTVDVKNPNKDGRARDDWTKAPIFPKGMVLFFRHGDLEDGSDSTWVDRGVRRGYIHNVGDGLIKMLGTNSVLIPESEYTLDIMISALDNLNSGVPFEVLEGLILLGKIKVEDVRLGFEAQRAFEDAKEIARSAKEQADKEAVALNSASL